MYMWYYIPLWLLIYYVGCIGSMGWQHWNDFGPQGTQQNEDSDPQWTHHLIFYTADISFQV